MEFYLEKLEFKLNWSLHGFSCEIHSESLTISDQSICIDIVLLQSYVAVLYKYRTILAILLFS